MEEEALTQSTRHVSSKEKGKAARLRAELKMNTSQCGNAAHSELITVIKNQGVAIEQLNATLAQVVEVLKGLPSIQPASSLAKSPAELPSFLKLPTEVLDKIMGFLPVEDQKNIRLTCQKLKYVGARHIYDLRPPASKEFITVDEAIIAFKEGGLHSVRVNVNAIEADLRPLKNMQNLRSLSLRGARRLEDRSLMHLEGSGIRELDLTDTNFSELAPMHLGKISSLERLSLEKGKIKETGLASLKDLKLREINFHGDWALDTEFSTCFMQMPLERLAFFGKQNFTLVEIHAIAQTSVRDLEFECPRWDFSGAYIQALKGKKIEKLSVFNIDESPASIETLREFGLKQLTIRFGPDRWDHQLISLAEILRCEVIELQFGEQRRRYDGRG